jgi:hypothetical protein
MTFFISIRTVIPDLSKKTIIFLKIFKKMKLFVNNLVSSTLQPTIRRLNSNLAFVPAHQIPEVTQLESLRQILEGINSNPF